MVWFDKYAKCMEGFFLGLFIHKAYFSSPPQAKDGMPSINSPVNGDSQILSRRRIEEGLQKRSCAQTNLCDASSYETVEVFSKKDSIDKPHSWNILQI